MFFGMELPFSIPEVSWGNSNLRTFCIELSVLPVSLVSKH